MASIFFSRLGILEILVSFLKGFDRVQAGQVVMMVMFLFVYTLLLDVFWFDDKTRGFEKDLILEGAFVLDLPALTFKTLGAKKAFPTGWAYGMWVAGILSFFLFYIIPYTLTTEEGPLLCLPIFFRKFPRYFRYLDCKGQATPCLKKKIRPTTKSKKTHQTTKQEKHPFHCLKKKKPAANASHAQRYIKNLFLQTVETPSIRPLGRKKTKMAVTFRSFQEVWGLS